jgi:OmpA-OmpF porin, OOP family
MSSLLQRSWLLGLLLVGSSPGHASRIPPQRIEMKTVIGFTEGKAVISPADLKRLDEAAQVLGEHPEIELIDIEGHTDDREAKPYQRLGYRRARAVRDHLVRRGLAATRLKIVDYGMTRPLAANSTAAGRAKNRRVSFRIVTVNGKPNPP